MAWQRLPLAALVALSIPSLAHAQDIDAAPLSAVNLLARDIGSGTGATALEFQQDRGVWMGGYLANTKLAPSGSDDIETVVRGPVLGYGLGWHNLSVFIGYGQGESYLDDDGGKARIRSYFWGLSSYGTLPAPVSDLTWGAALFTGGTHNKISSPTNSGGIADYDGRLIGLSLDLGGSVWDHPTQAGTGIDFAVHGHVVHHSLQSYDLEGADIHVGDRTSLATRLNLEIGAPFDTGGARIRPYIGYTFQNGNDDDLGITSAGITSDYTSTDYLNDDLATLGVGVTVPRLNGLKARLETSRSANSDPSYALSIGMAF